MRISWGSKFLVVRMRDFIRNERVHSLHQVRMDAMYLHGIISAYECIAIITVDDLLREDAP